MSEQRKEEAELLDYIGEFFKEEADRHAAGWNDTPPDPREILATAIDAYEGGAR